MRLTKFELEIMDALWELGSASVREIQEALPEKKQPAYTTVQTIVRRLEEKGAVRKLKKVGNAFVFEPVVTRKAAHHKLINELLEVFGGSVRPLMAHLAESGKLGLEDVRELESILAPQDDAARQTNNPKQKTTGSTIEPRGTRR